VNKNLRIRAYKLLKSSGQALEMSNTVNAFKAYDLDTFVYHRLSSTTQWMVLGDQKHALYGPMVLTSQEPELRTKDAPDATRDILVTSGQQFIYGCPMPNLVFVGNV
jgi:hypothetical protein